MSTGAGPGTGRPLPGRTGRVAELVTAGCAGAAVLLGVLDGPPTALVLVCLGVAALPWVLLVAGRDLPVVAFAALAIAPVVPVVAVTGPGGAVFCTTVAACRVAGRTSDRRVLAATAVVVAAVPSSSFLFGQGDYGAGYFTFGSLFAVLVGVLLRRATQLSDDLQTAHAALAEAAAREERSRIARDVHDLVAHSLTVVVLHVGGARRVLRTDPGAAEDALADAERVCRESLDGIRGVVGLLRDDGEPRALSLDLAELVDGYRAAGRPIALAVTGDPTSLPLALRVALHRVVQESLANAARHAGGAPTSVDVAVEGARVSARIANPVPAPPVPAPPVPAPPVATPPVPSGGGYGLLGLRERVTSLGGELTAGPDGDAWVVRAVLPVRPDLPVRTGAEVAR